MNYFMLEGPTLDVKKEEEEGEECKEGYIERTICFVNIKSEQIA